MHVGIVGILLIIASRFIKAFALVKRYSEELRMTEFSGFYKRSGLCIIGNYDQK
jgi:hypothetical protein